MNKTNRNRLAFLAAFQLGGLVAFPGCEPAGPAQQQQQPSSASSREEGADAEEGDEEGAPPEELAAECSALSSPGNMEKAGRDIDKSLKQ